MDSLRLPQHARTRAWDQGDGRQIWCAFQTDSWHKVLKGIEEALAGLRNKPGLTDKDRAEITHYSEAATQFRHFKDAWRNHVSHARASYDEREAWSVLVHVRKFMQHLAANA
jgi:hypothetical protein